jgi:HlyD family secretion protein
MKTKIKRLFAYAKSHRKISVAILIAVGVILIYLVTRTSSSGTAVTQYVFSKVQKQDIVISVTGSGQVSALDQVDIAAEVAGTVDYIGVKAGDIVAKGKVIAHLDSTDAQRVVDNASLNLTNAKIAYEKAQRLYKNQLGESTTTLSDLAQARDDGFDAVSNAFIDLPKIFMDVSDIYYDPTNSPYFSSDLNVSLVGGDNALKYKYDAGIAFDSSKKDYGIIFEKYKDTGDNASQQEIINLISSARDLVKKLSMALTGTYNTIDYLSDRMTGSIPSEVSIDKSVLSAYITKTTGHVSKLSAALSAIEDAETSATTAEINLKTAELALNQAEDSLKNAQEALANHTIVAPFDGVIAKIPLEVNDKISNSGTAATIITKTMKVSISLNEVDATKVKTGDKATLTFDAIDGLTMQGTVYEVDVLGSVSNGVVSYGINISFDSTDDRIKAGMTTSISISTGSAQNSLAVSSAAISEKNGKSYVLVPISNTTAKSTTDKSTLKEVEVKTGLSGDEFTEIKEGLAEDSVYVSGTKTSANKNSSGSLFGSFGSRQQGTTRSTSSSSRTTASTPIPPQ